MRSMSVKHFFSKYEKGTKTADVATILQSWLIQMTKFTFHRLEIFLLSSRLVMLLSPLDGGNPDTGAAFQ